MADPLKNIAGAKGPLFIDDTSNHDRSFDSIQFNEPTVIAELYYTTDKSHATNLAGSGHFNIAGKTLNESVTLFSKSEKSFGRIKLTSGSVIIH